MDKDLPKLLDAPRLQPLPDTSRTHNVALSDYRRLTRRGALSASSIAGSGAAEPGGGVPRAVLPGPC